VAFALALAQAELDLRPPLTAVYRALRDAGEASGEELRAVLEGDGRYPRSPLLCSRLLAVLVELGLAAFEDRRCTLISGVRANLEAAPTYRRCQEQLREARMYLATAVPGARRAAA
jgi:hypothetical protein